MSDDKNTTVPYILIEITYTDSTHHQIRCDMNREHMVEAWLIANPPATFYFFTDLYGVFHAIRASEVRRMSEQIVTLV